MTCEPCEAKEAGASRSSNKMPNSSIRQPPLGRWWIEPETWGPPGEKLELLPAWLTAVTWLRSRANGLQRAAVGIASGRPEWEATLHGRPQVG